VNTGLSLGIGSLYGRGCWYDKNRFAFLQAEYLPAEHREEIRGLYYLNALQGPIVSARIDLSPIDVLLQTRIQSISCQSNTIIVRLPSETEGSTRIYGVRIGAKAELLSDMRGTEINLANGYVIGSGEIVKGGIHEGRDDCKIVYLKPGLKALCWSAYQEKHWLLPRFVIGEYKWQEKIKARNANGRPELIPNPDDPKVWDRDVPIIRYVEIPGRTDGARMIVREPQPPGVKGIPASYAIVLYGLDQTILAVVDKDPVFKIFGLEIAVNPSATYAYAPCIKKTESKYDLDFDGICRLALDGKPNRWEQLFSFDIPARAKAGIQKVSVSFNGDVAFAMPGARYPNSGIWKFDVLGNHVVRVTNPERDKYDAMPIISPDGKSIAFTRSNGQMGTLMIAQLRENKP
jgi:hypothetical protein